MTEEPLNEDKPEETDLENDPRLKKPESKPNCTLMKKSGNCVRKLEK